jgi:nicotinate-nucleotide adenylyltransferase
MAISKQVLNILFGGSFDPPHRGHLRCLELALRKFSKAKVWLVPARQAATVPGREKQASASFADRVAMCRLLLEDLSAEQQKRVELSTVEAQLPLPNYTVNTLAALSLIGGLLLGDDQLANFAQWRDVHTILRRCSLLVVGRDHFSEETTVVQSLLQKLGFTGSWHPAEQRWDIAETGTAIYLLGGSSCDAASSEVRRALNAGSTISPAWLSPQVEQYIVEKNLYLNKE